jgi:DNA-binding transcriptional LysR family regulator
MRDLNDIQSFAAVVTHHGFAPAARALGTPKSSLSRHVTRLESRLGVRLLERSTRHLRLTDAGASFYRHCQSVLTELAEAEESIALLRSEPAGLVRVASHTGFSPMLGLLVPEFMKRYPRVQLQLVVTNRRVDLIEESIDVALRARSRLDDSNLTMRTLGRSTALLVASPEFLAARPPITSPEALADLPYLSVDESDGRQQVILRQASGESRTIALEPVLRTSDFFTVREAAIAGIGFSVLPGEAANRPVRDGRLIHFLPEWQTDEVTVHLVFTSRRGLLPAVRAFIDHLAERLPAVREECLEL